MLRLFIPLLPYPYKGESVHCPVCDSSHSKLVSRIDRKLKRLNTVICEECGLFYTNPMPTARELEAYYRDTYRLEYQFAFFGPPKSHIQKKQKEAVQRAEILKRFMPKNATEFLDVGCGSGELVRYMASQSMNSFGFEPGATYSQSHDKDAKSGSYKIENADWQTAQYPENKFDAITMLHVLEHLRQPVDALRKIKTWLKDDGIFYLEVPNLAGYSFKCFEHFHFAHVLGFSRANLILCAQKAGFDVVEVIADTSIIFKKSDRPSEVDRALLKATAERNYFDYTQNVSVAAYVIYHVKRNIRRLLR